MSNPYMYAAKEEFQRSHLMRDRQTAGSLEELLSEYDKNYRADSQQIGGDHYKNKSIQPWDVMESWMGKEGFAFYLQGNVLKYISRYKEKNGLEDLKKAKHYLEKLIEIEGE